MKSNGDCLKVSKIFWLSVLTNLFWSERGEFVNFDVTFILKNEILWKFWIFKKKFSYFLSSWSKFMSLTTPQTPTRLVSWHFNSFHLFVINKQAKKQKIDVYRSVSDIFLLCRTAINDNSRHAKKKRCSKRCLARVITSVIFLSDNRRSDKFLLWWFRVESLIAHTSIGKTFSM